MLNPDVPLKFNLVGSKLVGRWRPFFLVEAKFRQKLKSKIQNIK